MQRFHLASNGLGLLALWSAAVLGAACAADPVTDLPSATSDASGHGAARPDRPDRSSAGARGRAALQAAPAGRVGYYDLDSFIQGVDPLEFQPAPIREGGGTPIPIEDPTTAALAGLDVLWVDTEFSLPLTFYPEWMSRQADLDAAVRSGMVLVIHDSGPPVNASPPVPGGAAFIVTRDLISREVTDINLRDTSTLVTDGLTDSSLDLRSADLPVPGLMDLGFVNDDLLPPTARRFLTRPSPAEIVTFCYPLGAGAVIYSSIPLSEYTAEDEGPDYYPAALQNAMTHIYAPNVVRYAVAGACKQ